MVVAVDTNFAGAKDFVQVRARHDLKHVSQVLLDFVAMVQGSRTVFGNVLKQAASAEDVDQLHAGADRQYRQPHFNGQFRDASIKVLTSLRHHSHGRTGVQSHADWVKIQCASRQYQASQRFQGTFQVVVVVVWWQHHGYATAADHAVKISLIEPT